MKSLIIGCGNIGSIAAGDLAASKPEIQVTVADYDARRAETVARRIAKKNIKSTQLDATNREQLVNTAKDFDVVAGFLPGKLGYTLAEACIAAGRNLVDVSFMAEDPLKLNKKAKRANVTIVPDCGLAPGISNFLVGHATTRLDKVQTVHIMVGGLPAKPVPPLGYVITWAPESLIDEYTRKAGIVRNGKRIEVEPLSGIEMVKFPSVGMLEAFYTDGLRTLVHTIGEAGNMWEKTLRYPGHAEKVKLLKNLGFLDEKQVSVEGTNISPKKLTAKLLGTKLCRPDIRDIVVLRVSVRGVRSGKRVSLVYTLLDSYDEKNGVTAMARTTAYPASIAVQLLLNGALDERGVIPLEKIAMNEMLYKEVMDELGKRGVNVIEEVTAL